MLRSRRKASVSAGARSSPRSSGACASAPRAGGEICHQRHLACAPQCRLRVDAARLSPRRSSFQRLDEDADGAATSEPSLPGGVVLDAELRASWACPWRAPPPLRRSPLPRRSRPRPSRGNSPAPSIASWLPTGCGRRAPGLNDGGKGHAAALVTPGERPRNDAWIARAHGRLKLPGANGSGLELPVIHDFLTD